jgi:hypothetical protein
LQTNLTKASVSWLFNLWKCKNIFEETFKI